MPNDDRDTTEDTGRSGFVRTVLSDLFETITDMDDRNQRRRTGTGSARRGNSRFDYGFTVGIGSHTAETEHDDTRETRPVADTDRTATVHRTDGGCVVTLDLPDVDPTRLSAGVDSAARTLVVGHDGEVIERVSLPRGDLDVEDASFNNGVLDVRLDGDDDE